MSRKGISATLPLVEEDFLEHAVLVVNSARAAQVEDAGGDTSKTRVGGQYRTDTALGDPVLEGVRYNRAQNNVTPRALGELLDNRMSD